MTPVWPLSFAFARSLTPCLRATSSPIVFVCSSFSLQLVGPQRVWLKSAPLPGLNMSRSVGDLIGKQAGIISQPHKATYALTPENVALILGSDGVSTNPHLFVWAQLTVLNYW